MWWMMGEGGGHYCSKKTDDICGNVCGQVLYFLFLFLKFSFQFKVWYFSSLYLVGGFNGFCFLGSVFSLRKCSSNG